MEAQKTAETTFNALGAIFVCSWGYDQTNIEFFKVVRQTPRTVDLVQIGSKPVGSDRVAPDPSNERGNPFGLKLTRKRIKSDGTYGASLRIGPGRGRAYLTDPEKSHYETPPNMGH